MVCLASHCQTFYAGRLPVMFDWAKHSVLGIGNPLLDLVVKVDKDFIKEYGLKPDDAILAEDKHLSIYERVKKCQEIHYLTGGSAQNTIVMLQWLIHKPGTCIMLGCIGSDKAGEILEENLKEKGVEVIYQKAKDNTPTGRCAVLITGEKRSLVTDLGACRKFDVKILQEPRVEKLIDRAKCFYTSCYFITSCYQAMLELAKTADKTGKLFVLNLGAPFLPTYFKEKVDELIFYADVVIAGLAEAESYEIIHTGIHSSPHGAAVYLSRKPSSNSKHRITIITQGSGPVIAIDSSDESIKEFPVVKVDKALMVDTNGGGDAFAAGFLAEYLSSKRLDKSINYGIKAAAYIIQRSGFSLGPREEFA